MDIRFGFQGVEGSAWMKHYMGRQILRLERYVSPGSVILIELIQRPLSFCSTLEIRGHKNLFSFESCGGDLFEAFSKTLNEACLQMKLQRKRKLSRIHRRLFFSETIDE